MTLPKQRRDESDADYAARLEASREAWKERQRKYYEANKEAVKEKNRKYREAKTLVDAKGKPLRSDFTRPQRPMLLTKMIIKVAEDFCRNYGFPLECKWDNDVLVHAAQAIRNSPELNGAANPWYGTDFLCPGLVDNRWAKSVRRSWRDKL